MIDISLQLHERKEKVMQKTKTKIKTKTKPKTKQNKEAKKGSHEQPQFKGESKRIIINYKLRELPIS